MANFFQAYTEALMGGEMEGEIRVPKGMLSNQCLRLEPIIKDFSIRAQRD